MDAITRHLDEYIEAVTVRNERVEDYNQLLCELGYVRGQLDGAKKQRDKVADLRQGSAQPGLPAMAKFSRGLRRHAWERCVEQLYMASRVYTLHTLDVYDVFADVLRKLGAAEAGDLDANALQTGLIEMISKKLDAKQQVRTNQEVFVPQGKHCRLTLTQKERPQLFDEIKEGRPGRFTLASPGAAARIEDNPFAMMADVRLTHVRCLAEGMKTSDGIHTLAICHSGVEWFVREDGRRLLLRHNDVLHMCVYDASTRKTNKDGALDADHCLIGPFTNWEISIPKNSNAHLDLSGLSSITVEFEGMYRGMPATASRSY